MPIRVMTLQDLEGQLRQLGQQTMPIQPNEILDLLTGDQETLYLGDQLSFSTNQAPPPPSMSRNQVSNVVGGGGPTQFTIPFATNPSSGAKVLAAVWSETWGGYPLTPTVVDNGTTSSQFVADVFVTVAAGSYSAPMGLWIFRADGITLPASGAYQLTVTWPVAPSEYGAGAVSYVGVNAGAPSATASNSSVQFVSSGNSGTVTSSQPSLYFAAVVTDHESNPAGIYPPSAPFSQVLVQQNGASTQAGAIADLVAAQGPRRASWSWSSTSPYLAAIAVYL
jgi:hypothetical protein